MSLKKLKISKRKIVVFLLVVLYVLAIKITMNFNGISSLKNLIRNKDALESVYYVIQIITGICLILSVVMAAWQYYLSTKCEMIKQNKEAVQKSIDMAEYYRTKILDLYEVLYYIYTETGMLGIIKSIKIGDMREFDENELKNNLPETQIEKIRQINSSTQVINALMKVEMVFGIDLGMKTHMKFKEQEGEKELQVNTSAVLRRYSNCIISEVLNCLEYFAMHFEHNTADESVIYQSVHQTYLELIQMLYVEICGKNKIGHKKYYTNVIGLYNKWYARYSEHRKNSATNDRQAITKGTIVNNLN